MLATANGVLSSYPVPKSGTLIIGRSEDSDVRIDDASVSRRHAELTIDEHIHIRDLGSANGTVVGGTELQPNEAHMVGVGQMVRIGSTVIVLQETSVPRRAIRWISGSLEDRVREECVRSARSGAQFAFAIVDIRSEADPLHIQELMVKTLRASDVVGAAPSVYEVLLVDTGPAEAKLAVDRLADTLTEQGLRSYAGLACYPRDGTSAHELIARAWATLRANDGTGAVRANPAMDRLRALMEQIADSSLSVLIRGETGVGKEVCAESLHRMSNRSNKPFLRINCAALSETLLESELFGHERGAFTGAHAAKPGLLETADTGSVFLDEIGELPPGLQAKLLRVLEDRIVTRVGGLEGKTIDVRFIAATNVDIEAAIESKAFRSDLYFRLSGVTLDIPPLRERADEIEGLSRAFMAQACARSDRTIVPELSDDAMDALHDHHWPGNIRELRNTIERALLLCRGRVIEAEHINTDDGSRISSPFLRVPTDPAARAAAVPVPQPVPEPEPPPTPGDKREQLRQQLAALEKQELEDALRECGGNQTRAAKLLGISRNTLQTRMDTHGIPRPRKRKK